MAKKTVINAFIKGKVKVKMLQFFSLQLYVKDHLNAKLRYNNTFIKHYILLIKKKLILDIVIEKNHLISISYSHLYFYILIFSMDNYEINILRRNGNWNKITQDDGKD